MSLEPENTAGRVTLLLGGARSGKSSLAERLAATRSGQSEAGASVLYVATSQPFDDEMRERIRRHQASRPASWRTIEAPYNLVAGVLPALKDEKIVLLDCLTVWLGNLVIREEGSVTDPLETYASYGEIYEDEASPSSFTTGYSSLEPDREENITSDLQAAGTARSVAKSRPDYARLEAQVQSELDNLVTRLQARGIGLIVVSNEVGMGLVPPYPMGRVYRDILGRLNQQLARLADEAFLVVAGLPIELKRLASLDLA